MSNYSFLKHYMLAEIDSHALRYPSPVHLGLAWSTGFLLLVYIVIQVVSGLILSLYYYPDGSVAWETVHMSIYVDLSWGWLPFYLHSCGASFIFILLYAHILRGLYVKSYSSVSLWLSGLVLFLMMMATAFTGYVLPWGQMSYWAATVITNFFSVIPFYGNVMVDWLWGAPNVNTILLNSIYSMHFLLAFVVIAIVSSHVLMLHVDGSTSYKSMSKNDKIWWFVDYMLKDWYLYYGFFLFSIIGIGFYPDLFGHPDNWMPADPSKTPKHIVPEWYFLPFYGIVKSIPHKLSGIATMFLFIVSLAFLPILDSSVECRNLMDRPLFKYVMFFLLMNFMVLGYAGSGATPEWLSMPCTVVHFLALLAMPIVSYVEELMFGSF